MSVQIIIVGILCLLVGTLFGKQIVRGVAGAVTVPVLGLLMSGPIALAFTIGALIVGAGIGSVVTWLVMR